MTGRGRRPPPPASLEERLQTYARQPRVRIAACVLALGVFAAQALVAARTYTPTPDESIYVPTGYYHLRTGDLAFDSTNPPLLKMAMGAPLFAMGAALDLLNQYVLGEPSVGALWGGVLGAAGVGVREILDQARKNLPR